MADFQRELLSATSPLSAMAGGAKSKKSKKSSRKHKESKKSSRKGSKHGSKHGSRKQSREMPTFMKNMLEIKKELKSKYSSLKDGPAMSKLVSTYMKDNNGDIKKALESLLSKSLSDLESGLDKINKEIAEKRASKKKSE